MRKIILSSTFALMLAACSLNRVDRPVPNSLEIASPTLRLIFPLDDQTLTPTATSELIFPIDPSDTPTSTPIGYDPTPTNTMVLIFPLEPSDTPVYCRLASGAALKIEGLVWLDKNGDGMREAGEGGIKGVIVDIAHSKSRVQSADDGSYELPVPKGSWPVIVHLPSGFYAFDVQTQDSHIVSAANGEGVLCAGTSYDVGLLPLAGSNHPANTQGAGQDNNNTPPPPCAQEPNNPFCTP
jgi:SdrD B-like domain